MAEQYRCPGAMKIPEMRRWHKKKGTSEIYCGVCLDHGCNGMEIEIVEGVNVINGYCYCPDSNEHLDWNLVLKPVVCDICVVRRPANSNRKCECGTPIGADTEAGGENILLCHYCSDKQRRCIGCGCPESPWQQLCRIYKVSADLKLKFLERQLTVQDLSGFDSRSQHNILAFQGGEADALNWE